MSSQALCGILVVDKPAGMTSSAVDRDIKKLPDVEKVGHIGTLDPFATGILLIAINAGTKIIPYMPVASKTYEFEVVFGEKTSTGDVTGNVIETSNKMPMAEEIEAILPNFIGSISQKPHAFSAVKVGGKRAYEIARKGMAPDIKSREVVIARLEVAPSARDAPLKSARFCAEVSPGTYIRSLAEDMATALGTCAHVATLRRMTDMQFSLNNAITLDELTKLADNLSEFVVPIEEALSHMRTVAISGAVARDLAMGRAVRCDTGMDDGLCLASADSGFVGVVEFQNGVACPRRLIVEGEFECL